MALLLLAAIPLAAQDTIRNDCCALLYSTGRWLGWSAAFLEYTRDRDAPTPADALLLQSLTQAGENAEAANASCLQNLPAWPGWRQKQQWLGHHIAELQKVDRTDIPDPSDKRHRNRRQLAFSAIDTTYGLWAGELSKARWNGDVLNEQTCATFYFQLGFALAAATQAFRQADEAWLAGDEQAASHQLAQTRLRLDEAYEVLLAYDAMAHRERPRVPCADIGIDTLIRMIEMIAHRAPTRASYPDELLIVSGISDRLGGLLLANCLTAGSVERESRDVRDAHPRDPDELAGVWTFHAFAWRSYIASDWESQHMGRVRQQQPTALLVRFEPRGGGSHYVGTIVRQPGAGALLPIVFDAFGGRQHLFRPGMELFWLEKIGPNHYRGETLQVSIPGPNPGFHRYTCDIVVFGEAAKLVAPARDYAGLLDKSDGGGDLMLRIDASDQSAPITRRP